MRLKSDLILFLVAAVWGSGFIAQSLAADRMSPYAFNGSRFLLAALLISCMARFNLKLRSRSLPMIILAGVLLFAASTLQQTGLQTTTVANTSFITGIYVVLVPIMISLGWKEKIRGITWAAALLSVAGVTLLSIGADFSFSPGDAFVLAGSFMWALHVIFIGRLALRENTLPTMIIQMVICGLLNFLTAFIIDPPGLAGIEAGWQAIIYSAIFPVAVGFTLQMVGQRHSPPVDAAIILSMETVFGAFFGYLFLAESLGLRQITGCVLILGAILLAQVPARPQLVPNEQPARD
jgi:drug/metabolite transporter (DMT)-like permease